ncbi:MAG: hypothetical protein ACI9O0_000368 [Paracoccaceae bacterium]|jgi:hypothetical protein
MFRALMNAEPPHLLDKNLFDFEQLSLASQAGVPNK